MMEHGVRVTLAYDGTAFAGFQRQPPETRTVQGVLEQAAQQITQHPVLVRGASRTDAGVHAEGQVASFATTRELPPRRWLLALNRYLPDDVAVHDAAPCPPDYEPRFDALEKTYRYLFHLGYARDPLLRTRAYHMGRDAHPDEGEDLSQVRADLDLQAMHAACAQLVGRHDFRAFRAADDTRENTERTLHRVELLPEWSGHPRLLALEVQGTAFMKNMVRILAGTLVAVGRGKLSAADVGALLGPEAKRHPACETAPAHGLTLVRITLGRAAASR
jgi:tRNA pseudouridine38-40 synthase